MKIVIKVDGMKCEHCKANVINGIKEIDGVENVSVNLDTKEVEITSKNNLDLNVIKNKVEEKGYIVI